MKGLKIIRAQPSNAIDIHALMKQAVDEEVFGDGGPTKDQLKDWYFSTLIPAELQSPYHFWYLARRGRGFLGLLHGYIIPGRWNGTQPSMYLDMVYVTEKRRKMGIGKKLIDELVQEAKNRGIKDINLLADDKSEEYWVKNRNAQNLSKMMRVEL